MGRKYAIRDQEGLYYDNLNRITSATFAVDNNQTGRRLSAAILRPIISITSCSVGI
ncbi:hypothetical protein MNBD_BACTEROID06-430 [hydrothermal vent metagenome]|uniref:Uncharacterized protein n=2 Tax=hydrothermal vent metagenome TaxID=652676 RepID=A0A3B0V917_9ZZZZ